MGEIYLFGKTLPIENLSPLDKKKKKNIKLSSDDIILYKKKKIKNWNIRYTNTSIYNYILLINNKRF